LVIGDIGIDFVFMEVTHVRLLVSS
jgi:hypothetical protein